MSALIERVGVVGLGAIGEIVASHLLHAGYPVTVFDLASERASHLETMGAAAAGAPRDVASQSDVVILSLPNPHAVEAVMLDPDTGILVGAGPKMVVVDMSTINPKTAEAMHARSKTHGVRYVDAPVSGGDAEGPGTDGARLAALTFMVGGDSDAFERVAPVLLVLGRRCVHLGPAGSGSTVKLISNLISGLNNLVISEAFALAARAGVGPQTLLDVFEGTDAKSYWMMHYFARRMLESDYSPGFSVDLQLKDHRLAADVASELGVPMPCNDLAIALYEEISEAGWGGLDLVSAVDYFGQRADAPVEEMEEATIRIRTVVRREI